MLSDLQPTTAWQFEMGTRGSWGSRVTWDFSVYDYELWNEIQNVNRANKSYISAVVTDDALGQSFYPGDGRAFYGGLPWRW